MATIKVGDEVKVIAGDNKNLTGKVLKVQTKLGRVVVEGIGSRERHYKKSYANPKGGSKEIQVGIAVSNVKLVKAAAKPARAVAKTGVSKATKTKQTSKEKK